MIRAQWRNAAGAALILAILGGCESVSHVASEQVAAAQVVSERVPGQVPSQRVASERVTFDSLERDSATGAPVRLTGLLFRLEGSDAARRPAVVAFHGCGGMYSAVAARRERLSLRHQAMAELLAREGYVVLFPDSFRPRGREEVCTVPFRQSTITPATRLADAQGALLYLQSRQDVAPQRIAALGWSHGGGTVLATQNAKQPAVAGWRDRPGSLPYFRAAVAFYPGCFDSLRARGGYAISAPLTLFVAGSDDWTAPQPCIELADRIKAAGEPVTITVYPDTYHGFDGPPEQGRVHLDVPNGVNPGRGVTVAPNPAAREDAYAKLKRFLRAEIGGP